MEKFKKIVSSLFVILFLMIIVGAPTIFAATNYFSFTMNNRYVDGDSNGEYHVLRAGNVYIKGTVVSTKQKNGSTKPNPLFVGLYRSKTGPDSFCGEIKLGNSSTINIAERKLGDADKTSGKYYLIAYKVEVDHWTTKANGKVYNK